MIIIGAGGHAKVIADLLQLNGISEIVFWVDNPSGEHLQGFPVRLRESKAELAVIIGVGNNTHRKRIALENSYHYTSAIHNSAVVSSGCIVGEGTVCFAGAIVNYDAWVGKHVIINTAAIVEHDCRVADFVHISPNATLTGAVEVGEGAWIGAGATVIPGIKIGKWSVIGAGSVVIDDVPDGAIVVGNPARIIKYNQNIHD